MSTLETRAAATAAIIHWYGTPIPEMRARPEKNRPREQCGQVVCGGLRRQPLDTQGRPIGDVLEFAVLRVEHWHPDGRAYLIVVERTARGWRADHEIGSVADALLYIGGRYMRMVA